MIFAPDNLHFEDQVSFIIKPPCMKHKNFCRLAIMQIIMIVAVNFISSAGMAQSASFHASIVPARDSDLKLKVTIDNPAEQKITVSISSLEHGVLVSKTFAGATYGCNYDFSTAEDGTYTIEVSGGKEKVKKEIIVCTVTEVSRKVSVQ